MMNDDGVTCYFTEFFHDLGLALRFGNVAHKEAQVWDANVYFQVLAASHIHIIQLREDNYPITS